jgi:hypothetical protein
VPTSIAARRRKRHVAHVPAQVEVLVVDPLRLGHAGDRRGEPLAVAGDQVQPRAEPFDDGVVVEPPPTLEHEDRADRHVDRPPLGGERRAVGR